MAVGGCSLFIVALLGFARMSGADLSEMAVVGKFFVEEPLAEETDAPVAVSEEDPVYTKNQVVDANVGILSAYSLDPPLTATELQTLAVELKTAKLEYEERLRELDEREERLVEREDLVGHQFETLEELRAELDRLEAELSLRMAELERDETAVHQGKTAQWAEISRLFATGDAEEMRTRLLQYDEGEAAEILSQLDPERAAALLNALPEDRWKAYVDAFSRATATE